MKKISFLILSSIVLSSCSFYKESFDCPPCKGVGCKSLTEIEAKIIETEEGPDRFIGFKETKKKKTSSAAVKCRARDEKRVWIVDDSTDGESMEGHYVFFSL